MCYGLGHWALHGLTGDVAEHPGKHDLVHGKERIPVREAAQSHRIEDRGLADEAAAVSAVTSNSSHARPGRFISAASSNRRPGSNSSTRQKSTVSPAAECAGCRRPRRIPRRREQVEISAQPPQAVASTNPCRRQSARSARMPRRGHARGRARIHQARTKPNAAPGPRLAAKRARPTSASRELLVFVRERAATRRRSRAGGWGRHASRGVLHHGRVNALHQLATDARVERRHQSQPQAGERGVSTGHRQHARTEPRCRA